MAFDIDDEETEELVRLLAGKLGVSPEEAILIAVRNELRSDDETTESLSRTSVDP